MSRYTLATSLTLLILVPFAIRHMLAWAKESNKIAQYSAAFVILLLTVESIDKLNIENKKYHIKDAGAWLSNHTAQGERVYSNNKLIIYYTDQNPDINLNNFYNQDMLQELLDLKQANQYDYIAYSLVSSYAIDMNFTQRLQNEYGDEIATIPGQGEQIIYVYQRK